MFEKLLQVTSLEEVGNLFLENWEKSDIDSLSEKNLNDFKKVLLNNNHLELVKKISPLSSYAYKRFNLTRAVISVLPEGLIREKLKFALWHRLIQHKTISFLEKVKGHAETEKKISYLLSSLSTLSNYKSISDKRDLSKYFMILSDLTGQLGFYMFSVLSAKNSVKTNPELVDATVFLGKAYLELGTAFANKTKTGKIKDHKATSLEYNFRKSEQIFKGAINSASPKLKEELNNLLMSISTVVDEITLQRDSGKNTIVQVVVEDYIQNRLEKVEDQIINYYKNSAIKFPTNIKQSEDTGQKEPDISSIFEVRKSRSDTLKPDSTENETLKVFDKKIAEQEAKPLTSKPGKLFDIYKNAGKSVNNSENIEQPKVRTGRIESDKIGYKLSLEDLQKIIKKKNEELNKSKK